ncbi:BglG family transcription antiterminator LicT [Romboutsia timonensis]|uniref:BglG family transcription antiterminator LicT n=1 Tax=Romboutsia timonensis TaxID=1776391 RepID=UPI002A74A1A5|nr:PRD domain-containing protein [Romboutsia timonensis]MCI6667691.1 PRD domain-containing protein [Romboutsia timonensis]MDY2882978.1 PRD domain-containing protein [Romboutsia timonensis]MDY3002127.1 PRD domain-containing protein [Romboutsia timonensis]MDY3960842.1 PRD domain-containing protein [Romboutsia timonensis]
MKIEKILNNNAFISIDKSGEEIVVMGRGIAFGKKQGNEVELSGGYKIFSNSDKELNQRLKNIVSDIPEEYMKITEQVVCMLEKEYDKKVNDIIYVSLTEHIHGAVERFKKGIQIKNPLLIDIKRLFRDEYEVSKQALEAIKEEFGIEFEEDEAGYIAQHIVNAQLDDDMSDIVNVTRIMQDILNIIKYSYKIDFNEESVYYYRFVTHLKFFAQRILNRLTYEDDNEDVFEVFKDKYNESYKCVLKIKEQIKQIYDYELSKDEQLYLMIHIERITTKATL